MKKIFNVMIIISFLLVWLYLEIPCLFRMLTGIPCPACGVTRALFALLQGDLQQYFYFHGFALPLSLCMGFVIYKEIVIQQYNNRFIITVCLLNIVYYLYRLIFLSIP